MADQSEETQSMSSLHDLNHRMKMVEKETREHRTLLAGDIDGKLGVMHHLLKLMEDVYGPENDKNAGLKSRVEKMERIDIRRVAWAAGAIFVAGGLATIVWKLLELAVTAKSGK